LGNRYADKGVRRAREGLRNLYKRPVAGAILVRFVRTAQSQRLPNSSNVVPAALQRPARAVSV